MGRTYRAAYALRLAHGYAPLKPLILRPGTRVALRRGHFRLIRSKNNGWLAQDVVDSRRVFFDEHSLRLLASEGLIQPPDGFMAIGEILSSHFPVSTETGERVDRTSVAVIGLPPVPVTLPARRPIQIVVECETPRP